MTDMERFIELYKSFGIELTAIEDADNDTGGYVIDLSAEKGIDQFVGYPGIVSPVHFDLNGKFIKQGFWD